MFQASHFLSSNLKHWGHDSWESGIKPCKIIWWAIKYNLLHARKVNKRLYKNLPPLWGLRISFWDPIQTDGSSYGVRNIFDGKKYGYVPNKQHEWIIDRFLHKTVIYNSWVATSVYERYENSTPSFVISWLNVAQVSTASKIYHTNFLWSKLRVKQHFLLIGFVFRSIEVWKCTWFTDIYSTYRPTLLDAIPSFWIQIIFGLGGTIFFWKK